jgi:predicted RND superfamily exporter protein
LIRFCLRHPKPVLAASAVVTVAATVAAFGLRFEDSVRSMRPEGSQAVEFREEVAERFGSGLEHMMLIIRGDSAAEVLRLADQASRRAEALVEEGVLTGVDSVASVLPSPARQAEILAGLERARDAGFQASAARARFEEALDEAGLRAEPFAAGLDLFEEALGIDRPIDLAALESEPQSRHLLERYLRHTPLPDGSEEWQTVVYLYTPPMLWRREAPPQALALADEMGPGVTLTGGNVVSAVLRASILEDAVAGVFVGFVLVGFLLWLDYRRLSDTLLTLAPLVMGIVWMLGTMSVLGIAMNFMNIFVTTMIIGIGVDYGVHAIHRFREMEKAGEGRLDVELVETGKAIAMAAVSTMVGFGSLSLSHYPGLRSMGLVAILGALSTCLVALTVLPAYLVLRGRRRGWIGVAAERAER